MVPLSLTTYPPVYEFILFQIVRPPRLAALYRRYGDWVVVVIGGYAGIGLIVYAKRIPFQNLFDKIIYGLLIFHLDGSVLLHAYILWAGSHEVLNVFSYGYSFFAVAYFVGLGYYVLRLQKRLYKRQQRRTGA